MFWYRQIERPTPEQWQLAAWMFIVALAGIGSVALWYAFQATPDKSDIATQLTQLGITSWGAAAGVWGIKRGIELFASWCVD